VDIEFEKLAQLQRLDTAIKQITLFLENIPGLIAEIDKKIEHSSQVAASAQGKMSDSQKKRRELEAEVKDIKDHIAKYKRQLNEVKTNKEYTALLKEIEESQSKVDRLEEEVIAEMLLADDIQKEIKEASQKFAKAKEKFSREKEAILQKKKETEEKAEKLNLDKQALLPQIPPEQVSLYLNIYRKKGGAALSPVKGDFCAMCHMRIRPQVLNELRDTRKLILCENCGRILFWQEKKKDSA
jgi:predicted  nucleic acid-binding Zn-ribbon protein